MSKQLLKEIRGRRASVCVYGHGANSPRRLSLAVRTLDPDGHPDKAGEMSIAAALELSGHIEKARSWMLAEVRHEHTENYINDPAELSDAEVCALIYEFEKELGIEGCSEPVKNWWTNYKVEYGQKAVVLLRLLEELTQRAVRIFDYFEAQRCSEQELIRANLHFLDFQICQRHGSDPMASIIPLALDAILTAANAEEETQNTNDFEVHGGASESEQLLMKARELLFYEQGTLQARKWWDYVEGRAEEHEHFLEMYANEFSRASYDLDRLFILSMRADTDNLEALTHFLRFVQYVRIWRAPLGAAEHGSVLDIAAIEETMIEQKLHTNSLPLQLFAVDAFNDDHAQSVGRKVLRAAKRTARSDLQLQAQKECSAWCASMLLFRGRLSPSLVEATSAIIAEKVLKIAGGDSEMVHEGCDLVELADIIARSSKWTIGAQRILGVLISTLTNLGGAPVKRTPPYKAA